VCVRARVRVLRVYTRRHWARCRRVPHAGGSTHHASPLRSPQRPQRAGPAPLSYDFRLSAARVLGNPIHNENGMWQEHCVPISPPLSPPPPHSLTPWPACSPLPARGRATAAAPPSTVLALRPSAFTCAVKAVHPPPSKRACRRLPVFHSLPTTPTPPLTQPPSHFRHACSARAALQLGHSYSGRCIVQLRRGRANQKGNSTPRIIYRTEQDHSVRRHWAWSAAEPRKRRARYGMFIGTLTLPQQHIVAWNPAHWALYSEALIGMATYTIFGMAD